MRLGFEEWIERLGFPPKIRRWLLERFGGCVEDSCIVVRLSEEELIDTLWKAIVDEDYSWRIVEDRDNGIIIAHIWSADGADTIVVDDGDKVEGWDIL